MLYLDSLLEQLRDSKEQSLIKAIQLKLHCIENNINNQITYLQLKEIKPDLPTLKQKFSEQQYYIDKEPANAITRYFES
ncbi:hypothetical protein [Aliikangiella maris]|uniref:Uncharacterized protein n=2 Tax=Aliikangiella maris TaxID=3162458 RepID=A0ABV2BX15_9GAMM